MHVLLQSRCYCYPFLVPHRRCYTETRVVAFEYCLPWECAYNLYSYFFSFLLHESLLTPLNSTASNTPVARRKRLRSVTPTSESNDHDPQGLATTESDDDSLLRSPLAKRKKLAAGRAGYSRLKEGITADELDRQSASTTRPSESRGSISSVPAYGSGYGVSVQENMWSRIGKINPGKSGSGSEGSGGGGMSDEGETDDAFGKIGRTNSRSKRKAGGGSWSDDEDGEMELGGDNENDYSRAVRKGMVGGDDDDESDSDDSSESGGMDDDDFLAGELDEEDWS